ncbi:MAG: hypothetical protein NTY42_02640 [Planctomycetota bacterium]|jgi:hypothetical protein|nr:hypothetical protein [Planctomycetota bacterium]
MEPTLRLTTSQLLTWVRSELRLEQTQQWVDNIAMLRLPEQAYRRLQQFMDRNDQGLLAKQERGFGGVDGA